MWLYFRKLNEPLTGKWETNHPFDSTKQLVNRTTLCGFIHVNVSFPEQFRSKIEKVLQLLSIVVKEEITPKH